MAESVAVTAPVAPAEKTAAGGKLKVILLLVVVLAAGVAGGMFLFSGGGEAAEETPTEAPPPEEGEVVTVAQMTTSLAGSGTHFARLEFAAVLNAEADATAVEEKFPLMRDAALSVLMGFEADELRTVAGADRLRAELTAQAQEIWEEEQVLRVVLTDLLVQ